VNDFLNLQTFIAFVLGVLLSAMVKGFVSSAKSKLSGA
jgi:hypothetical protein